jgi:CRISPR/Cas system-associated exonuclease Cas4 (RecB family)
MSRHRYLTKSRFKLAAECPTKLFYSGKETVYRNMKQEDSFMAMLADGGYQVGELAKCYFPEGIEVSEIAHEDALQKTTLLLQKEKVTIFEAAIRYGDLFIRVDVLVKDGNQFKLIEVKAKSYNSDKPEILGAKGDLLSGMRPYIEDVAFQAYVFCASKPHAEVQTYLMMPDKSVVCDIDGLNQHFKIKRSGNRSKVVTDPRAKTLNFDRRILCLVRVDEYVELVKRDGVAYLGFKEQLPKLAADWSQAYKNDLKIEPQPTAQCAKCEFRATPGDGLKSGFEECWSEKFGLTPNDLASGTVLDIWDFRDKSKLISEGRVRMNSVREDDIKLKDGGEILSRTERQWMQATKIPESEDKGGFWIAESWMRQEISNWKYPYHFIDFETSGVALPYFSGMRPYEQIAFQFSHHVMHSDGRVEHVGQFLMTEPVAFPNFVFARALKSQLENDQGTIFMWSPHENTILNRIVQQLINSTTPPADAPELIAFMESITRGGNREMYDLCKLSKDAYFHVSTKGSSSIKKVLPAVMATSSFLREQYSQPIYGADAGIPSMNYQDFTWWQPDEVGNPQDPYSLLTKYAEDLLGETVLSNEDPDDLVIAEGGAATTAYARLQFESLNPETRIKINEALLRYCELDTLAMLMIVQAWKRYL